MLGRGPNLCSLGRQEYENLLLQFDIFFAWLVQLVNLHFAVLRSPDFLLQSNVVLITALVKSRHSTCVLLAVLPLIFHVNRSNLLTLPSSSLPAMVEEFENPRGCSVGSEGRVSFIHIESSDTVFLSWRRESWWAKLKVKVFFSCRTTVAHLFCALILTVTT